MAALIGASAMGLLSLPRELGKAKASKSVKELLREVTSGSIFSPGPASSYLVRAMYWSVVAAGILYVDGWSFRGGRVPSSLDDRLRRGSGGSTAARHAQRRWP